MSRTLSNPNYIRVWLEASKKTFNKSDLGSLRVYIALNELQNSYLPLDRRIEIFDYLQQAARTLDPRGVSLLGLAFAEGYGCSKDEITGTSLVRAAAGWLKCDLAIDYLNLCEGKAYLFGDNVAQNYELAIKHLKLAGAIAKPELKMLEEHFKLQA